MRRRPARTAALPYPEPADPAVSLRMRRNHRTDTRPETRLRSALHRRGLRFRKDRPIRLPGLIVRPDLVFGPARVAVFVDGCFWHRCPAHGTRPQHNSGYWRAKLDRNVERDRRVDAALTQAGWGVVRVWEHEELDEALEAVLAALDGRA